jgi:hypothetical protein
MAVARPEWDTSGMMDLLPAAFARNCNEARNPFIDGADPSAADDQIRMDGLALAYRRCEGSDKGC